MTPSFPTLRSSDLTSPRVRPVSTGKDGVVRRAARASVGNRPEDAIAPEMKPRRFSMAAPVRQGQRLLPSRTPWEGLLHEECRQANSRPAFRDEAHRPSQNGREHVRTPVTKAPLVCRLQLESEIHENNIQLTIHT